MGVSIRGQFAVSVLMTDSLTSFRISLSQLLSLIMIERQLLEGFHRGHT